ncbi:DUF421 domain-containing protein [Anaeromicropila herbilytica]|uniref:YetF C-terminal domain-containing protein n=1 Tax=Anaeromicropila herbilytica TaxID=2785025 RepID=A0A7R7IC38_9FIRM|nr:DUF421 domain-containing protein [Anaeromicropila herbilytica]BCN29494.1 hypothetical protein bsdtb5_07890 [Anaeromicropila herbilytica]
MEIIRIIITSLASLLVLFIVTKIMGDRQISELSMFDYINGITIGSIAAEMATSLENDYMKPMTAMIVYGIVSTIISFVTCKSIRMRRFIEGKTMILFHNDCINQKNLLKAKIDIDEFLSQCRQSGYFSLNDIHTVLLEPNGKMSILPKVANRPVTPDDLSLTPTQELPSYNVIIDGNIMHGNLKASGRNEDWLTKQLHGQGVKDISQVILATADKDNNFYVYLKQDKSETRDIFE